MVGFDELQPAKNFDQRALFVGHGRTRLSLSALRVGRAEDPSRATRPRLRRLGMARPNLSVWRSGRSVATPAGRTDRRPGTELLHVELETAVQNRRGRQVALPGMYGGGRRAAAGFRQPGVLQRTPLH